MARLSKTSSKASEAKARKASQTKGRKTAKTKRHAAPAAKPRKRRSVSELEAQLQLRTKELDEALARQNASAEILKVINASPGDLTPVFNIILKSAHSLCDVTSGSLQLFDGDHYRAVAVSGVAELFEKALRRGFPITDRVRHPVPVQNADLVETLSRMPNEESLRAAVDLGGIRTNLLVPLVKDGVVIGRIVAARREVRPFTDKQIALLQSFADQAVIAIENARLFKETQEALERQTATAEILKVIASSPTNVQPVFEAIAESAKHLIGGQSAIVTRVVDDQVHLVAFTKRSEAGDRELQRSYPIALTSPLVQSKVARTGEYIVRTDIDAEPPSKMKELARARGYRSSISIPMLRDGISIGTISITRKEPGPFSKSEIDLVKTFADQAVIAIQNARMFDEVQAKTRDLSEALTYQTGSASILNVIASSPTDVGPVLKAIVESACELCEAYDSVVYLRDSGDLHPWAHHGPIRLDPEKLPIARNSTAGRAFLDRKPVHVHDYLSAEGDDFPVGQERARRFGFRSVLSVPLSREGESIGIIVLRRTEATPFSDKQIALLQTFADQAVIAIGNVRLFEQVQARTKELAASLDELRTAQDRLVQTEKLASLGQLTAGIAHEIKNPLNFVNNFSALSAELIDELDETLTPAPLDQKIRGDVRELTQMLKSNLEKVVQHGKRADSIVKNMLLHSRQGSGEHRPVDINAIVDESLNLAYHGARAENTGFNIAMHRSFDPAVGMADGYPQEITRALLNLISNGFYAATKRKADADDGFEPTLTATTRNLGDKVEIRIRDNGIGIPAGVKEKIFNPFFTTKPAGEGTGLGLSMSHDIIVKQHGGTIDVVSEPGAFTEFCIVLPRAGAALIKSGEEG